MKLLQIQIIDSSNMSQYVKIYYGPNDSFGTVCHRPQKLYGLRDNLRKCGFRVDIVPVEFRDYCMIETRGHEIFRCNIGNLAFNLPSELDPVCQRAVAAVKEANTKLFRARTYFWIWSLIDEEIFMRNEYAPKNHWPVDVKFKPISSCAECVSCCEILARVSD